MFCDAIWNLLSDVEKHLLIFELCLSKLDFSEVPHTLKIYDSQNTWDPKKCRGGEGACWKEVEVADIQGCISLRQRKRDPGAQNHMRARLHGPDQSGPVSWRLSAQFLCPQQPFLRTQWPVTLTWGLCHPFPVSLSPSCLPSISF